MKTILFSLLLFATTVSYAQVSVDTTKGHTTVTEKVANITRTLSIYTTFIPQKGKTHRLVYDPGVNNESGMPTMSFTTESVHLKSMIDAALSKKPFNFTRISIDILPYKDLIAKLADIYENSKEWNDYLRKAGDLHRTLKLDDGNEITEIGYDPVMAMNILEKSDFMQALNNLFAPYGYKATSSGFLEEHQVILTPEQLMTVGKSAGLFVPVPEGVFILTKIK